MGKISLRVEALTKSYAIGSSRVGVLRNLEAIFPAGEVSTIEGSSGSGKSTLLHLLGGLETPDEGKIRWGEDSIYDWPREKRAEWRQRAVGFVFQAYHLLPELSALENVDMPARLAGRGSMAEAGNLLERMGLKERGEHRPGELSGGEQQRVAIARALRNDPDLLLADEPTGNLDAATGAEIINLLLGLQREKLKTLIIVTHDANVAARGQHRFRLANGQLEKI